MLGPCMLEMNLALYALFVLVSYLLGFWYLYICSFAYMHVPLKSPLELVFCLPFGIVSILRIVGFGI